MPLVEEKIAVTGTRDDVFTLISDFPNYPSFMENVKRVTILEEQGGEGGETRTVTEWVNEVDGRLISWTERDLVRPADNRIDFKLVKGDLKELSGFWSVNPLSNPVAEVEVHFSIYFEFGISMLAPLLHPLLAKKLRENMKQMLQAVKKQVEKEAQPEHG